MPRNVWTRVRQWKRAVDNGDVTRDDDYWSFQASVGEDSQTSDSSRDRLTSLADARPIQRVGEYDGERYHRFQLVEQTVAKTGLFDGSDPTQTWIAYPEGDTLRLLSTDFDETRRLNAGEVDSDEYTPVTTWRGTPVWAY